MIASFIPLRGVQASFANKDNLKSPSSLNINRKITQTWLKILVYEIKRCSQLHFAEAQPQLNLFLTFD